MSYKFKVDRGWASSGYGAKKYWDNPEKFTVIAETEREATDKAKALTDTASLAAGNRYLYRVTSAEELPPAPTLPAWEQLPSVAPRYPLGTRWRGTTRSVLS